MMTNADIALLDF